MDTLKKLMFYNRNKRIIISSIESFFKKIKYEYLNGYRFNDMEDVRYHVDYFIRFYNERRIHQSLGYLEPSTASSHVEVEESKSA
ncbi:MAG: integrase core domain-containing protein [Deferribacterales bacterium]